MRGSRETLLGLIILPTAVLACASWLPVEAAAATARVVQSVETTTYRIKLDIGPPVQAMGMGGMLTMDQGRPVNRHLTVVIQDRRSGALVTTIMPTIKITDDKARTSRDLATQLCLPPDDHGAGPHFGNNVYLPEGKYTITVTAGRETATFTVSL